MINIIRPYTIHIINKADRKHENAETGRVKLYCPGLCDQYQDRLHVIL